jgi:hypothetical protein
MVYRLGERIKPKRRKFFEQAVLAISICSLSTVGTVYAFNKKVDTGTWDPTFSNYKNTKRRNSDLKKSNKNSQSTATVPTAPEGQVSGAIISKDCGAVEPIHQGLAASYVPSLRKLAEYEQVCGGSFVDAMMFFTNMPRNSSEATEYANNVAAGLKQFAKFGIKPLVVLEPTTSAGYVNFQDFKSGAYDSVLDAYFSTLKSLGINDQTMGVWVPFPESNIPEWGNTNPDDVSACITKTVQFQKKHFPGSKASVLLDSKSYPSGNSWNGGSYASLVPYVKNIPAGLIDSFGLQGYPWPDPQPDHSAAHFLNPQLAKDAANQLGVKDIWLSTGTYHKGTAWTGQVFSLSPAQRQAILADIINQAKQLKVSGFNVSVHIFAENKLGAAEGNDWSYWDIGKADSSPATPVFKTFVNDVRASGMKFWLFDS